MSNDLMARLRMGTQVPEFALRQEAADKIEAQAARIAELEAALRYLVTAAKLLRGNSAACVRNHHGHDMERDGVPVWLAHADMDIARARAALGEEGNGGPPADGSGSLGNRNHQETGMNTPPTHYCDVCFCDPCVCEDDDEHDAGDDCGRWNNGRLSRSCSLFGTEFCDWECPYRAGLMAEPAAEVLEIGTIRRKQNGR